MHTELKPNRTSIQLRPGYREALDKIGAKEDRTMSYLINKAIDEFLKKNEKKSRA